MCPVNRRTAGAAAVLAIAVAGGGGHAATAHAARHASAHAATPARMVASVIAYAQAQVGKPYVFGAAGPSAFDCSGLAWAAWANAGLHWSRTTSQQQWATLPHVSHPRPGDLVFFIGASGTLSAPDHVGVVVDPSKKKMIDAYGAGYGVETDTYGLTSSKPGLVQVVGFARPSGT
jgi:cell wall-associated NlpC family hydrolase